MNDPAARLEELRIARTAAISRRLPLWVPWTFGFGALLILVLVVWLVADKAAPATASVPSPPPQTAAGAAVPPSGSLLDASGYIVAQREATVSSKITGRLVAVFVEEGQHVKEGQILARLDDANAAATVAEMQAEVAQADAGLNAAKVALADAQPSFDRNEELFRKSVISSQDVEASRASFNAKKAAVPVAEQAVAVARAALGVAKQNLDDTVVRAPFSGVVVVKAAQAGEMVSPAATGGFTRTGICTIVDMDSLEVEVDVSEAFISRVHSGQPATVRLNAYPDWAIPAKVLTVIPTADRSKATVKVRVAFDSKDPRIVPDMGARVSFREGESSKTSTPGG